MEQRGAYRRLLFGEAWDTPANSPYNHIDSLAKLALDAGNSLRGKRLTIRELDMQEVIPHNVDLIIRLYNQRSRPNKDKGYTADAAAHNAIFGMTNDARIERVSDIVSKAIWTWRRAIAYAEHPLGLDFLPFDTITQIPLKDRDFVDPDIQLTLDTQLTLEAAASVIEMRQAGFPLGSQGRSRRGTGFAGVFARHGPEYSKAWLRRDVIRAHCEEQGFSAKKTRLWTSLLTTPQLARVAIYNQFNPLDGIKNVMRHFTTTFTDRHLEKLTDWGIEKRRFVFRPYTLAEIAIEHGLPEEKIKKIAKLFDEDLDPANIANATGITVEDAETYFPRWARARMATTMNDPFKKVPKRAEMCERLIVEYRVQPKIAAFIVHMHSTKSLEDAVDFAKLHNFRVPDLPEAEWAELVIRTPGSNNRLFRHGIGVYRLWLRVSQPSEEYNLSPQAAEKELYMRARLAGISDRTMKELIRYASNHREITRKDKIYEHILQLREAFDFLDPQEL